MEESGFFPPDDGWIVAVVHHFGAVDDLHPGGQLIIAILFHHMADGCFVSGEQHFYAEFLRRLQSAAHRGLGSEIAPHCINDYLHGYSFLIQSAWCVAASSASSARWDRAAFLLRFPLTL